ncbi:MAG: hypothetical protein QXU45_06115 [Candidatus Bathyarchaeia archaeon]
MELEKEIDRGLVEEVLRILCKYKDKTLWQIATDLQRRLRKPISISELYELLKQMNDMGLVLHREKMVKKDIYEITAKGLEFINPYNSTAPK